MGERPFSTDTLRLERQRKLQVIGVERLSLSEMQAVGNSFGQHLRAGLEKRPSSLATIPTLLQPVDLTTIPSGKQALVVEMGGTNVYGGLIRVENGEARLLDHAESPLVGAKNRTFSSSTEFFGKAASGMKSLLYEPIDTLGIIWSFPATIQEHAYGVDATSAVRLPKELVIPGVDKEPVGDQLIRALQQHNETIPSGLPRVVVNDTAAVLLANGGVLGGIVGTGFNIAFAHGGEIFNLEAGGFNEVPHNGLTEQIDRQSEKPGHYLAEKQISGKYVEDLFTEGARQLGIAMHEQFTAPEIDDILLGRFQAVSQKIPGISTESLLLLQEEAEVLRDRSAQLVAAMVSGTIQEFPEDFLADTIQIPIEGSFFGKTPGYQEAITAYTAQLLPDKVVSFTRVSKSGIKGAGVAALGLLQ